MRYINSRKSNEKKRNTWISGQILALLIYYQSNLKLDIYAPSTQLIPSAQEKHRDSINVSSILEF